MLYNRISIGILLASFILYYSQGLFFGVGSNISQVFLLAILFISLLYFFKAIFTEEKKELFFLFWTFLLLANVLGFLWEGAFSRGPILEMFKSVLICLLAFYPFYYSSRKGDLKSQNLKIFFLIMLPIVIFQFFRNQKDMISLMEGNDFNVVNNVAYSFISLLPYVFFFKGKRIMSGILIAIIFGFTIYSSKRGAIIACILGLLLYFYFQFRTMDKQNRYIGYTFFFMLLFGIGAFTVKSLMANEFLITRMTSILEGDLSGRELIYTRLFDYWYNGDTIWDFIFGSGFASSLKIVGIFAHNDWLELLTNFGIFGIIIYLILFYSAVRLSVRKDWLPDKRILMFTILVLWFFISLVSMWYTSIDGFGQAALLGYLVGSRSSSLE
jgi:hypothetical protein